uniref:Uncharacterized protein n=1 Tax=Chenopodium quinoa TaxID=63459 RepID=A0A803MM48_CHEQI
MDAPLTQVVISFRPLLKQITRCLDFPDPEYQYLNLRKRIACVAIRRENSVVPTVYLGGDIDNVDDTCEIAAKKGVYDLIKRYDIVVEDVSALHKQMYERCGRLYGYKKEELKAIEKGKSKVNFHGDISTEIDHNQRKVVIDFLEVLRSIFRCVDDCVVPVGEDFQAPMPNPPVIAFNKIELKSQVAESFAISGSSIEEFQRGQTQNNYMDVLSV